MYRIVFIISLFVASSYIGIAQINQKEYKQLIDYVNCKYAVKYINEKRISIAKEKGGEAYLKDFYKRKNAFETNVSSLSDINKGLDKSKSNSTTIYEALRKSATGFEKARVLWQYIDDKKKNFNLKWTTEAAINSAISLSDDDIKISGKPVNFKTFLKSATSELRAELPGMLVLESTDNNEMDSEGKDGSEDTQADVQGSNNDKEQDSATTNISNEGIEGDGQLADEEESAQEQKKEERASNSAVIPKFLILIIILGAVIFVYFKRSRIGDFLKKQMPGKRNDSQSELVVVLNKNDALNDELNNLNKQIQDLKEENSLLHNTMKELKQQFDALKTQIVNQQDKSLQSNVVPLVFEPRQSNEKLNQVKTRKFYADAIIDGEFNKITEQPNSDTVYELKLQESLRRATFDIFSGAYQRVLKNADFVDGCEKQKLTMQPTNLEVVYGEVEINDLGNWRITKRAIVKFI